MLIVGLTGGIASGKSTLVSVLKQFGIPIFDCDAISHRATAKGAWGYRRVLAAFGDAAPLLPNGELDRAVLGAAVFSDPAARRKLNRAVHLPVAASVALAVAGRWFTLSPLVVVDMPLLFETKSDRWCGCTVLVSAPEKIQLRRLMARDGLSEAEARKRIASQMPLADKAQRATIVIDNSGTLEELKEKAAELVAELTQQRAPGPLRSALVSPYTVLGLGWTLVTWAMALVAAVAERGKGIQQPGSES